MKHSSHMVIMWSTNGQHVVNEHMVNIELPCCNSSVMAWVGRLPSGRYRTDLL